VVEEWTTKSGKTIKIKDMTDSHLVNTIHFLERKHEAREAGLHQAADVVTEEKCKKELWDEAFKIASGGPSHPAYPALVQEAGRRKLISEKDVLEYGQTMCDGCMHYNDVPGEAGWCAAFEVDIFENVRGECEKWEAAITKYSMIEEE